MSGLYFGTRNLMAAGVFSRTRFINGALFYSRNVVDDSIFQITFTNIFYTCVRKGTYCVQPHPAVPAIRFEKITLFAREIRVQKLVRGYGELFAAVGGNEQD